MTAVGEELARMVVDAARDDPALAADLAAALQPHLAQGRQTDVEISELDSDPLLTAVEAGELLGFTARYVGRLGRKGALERFKHPDSKYVRYRRSAVLAFRNAGCARRTPSAPACPAPVEAVDLSRRTSQARARRRF